MNRLDARIQTAGKRAPYWPVVMPARGGRLQRQCACGGTPGADGECEECKKKGLQRKAATAPPAVRAGAVAPPIVHDVLRAPGQPLDAATRAFMEPRFGHDFGAVRIHADQRAAESARAVQALAYTVGPNIVFGPGQFQPATTWGAKLLTHELAHVVQQRAGAATGPSQLVIDDSRGPAEQEAARAAQSVGDGNSGRPLNTVLPQVSRQPADAGGGAATTVPAPGPIPATPATTPGTPSSTSGSLCPADWLTTVQADHARGLDMLDRAIAVLGAYDGTNPPTVHTALDNSFHASSSAFAGWVRVNLRLLRLMAPMAGYKCETTGQSAWCGPGTLAETAWCVPLFDVRVCASIYFDQSPLERSTTLIHEWVHKYGCNFDLGYRGEPGYVGGSTLRALVNADPFAQLVKDIQ